MISTTNSPGRKSSLERIGAALSFIIVFGTLLLCQNRFFLSNPWQTWLKSIQIHLSTYKDLCSLTDRQGVWWQHPHPFKLWSHTHTHTYSPFKKRGKESSHAPHSNIYRYANIKFCFKKSSYRFWQNIKSCSFFFLLVKWNLLLR